MPDIHTVQNLRGESEDFDFEGASWSWIGGDRLKLSRVESKSTWTFKLIGSKGGRQFLVALNGQECPGWILERPGIEYYGTAAEPVLPALPPRGFLPAADGEADPSVPLFRDGPLERADAAAFLRIDRWIGSHGDKPLRAAWNLAGGVWHRFDRNWPFSSLIMAAWHLKTALEVGLLWPDDGGSTLRREMILAPPVVAVVQAWKYARAILDQGFVEPSYCALGNLIGWIGGSWGWSPVIRGGLPAVADRLEAYDGADADDAPAFGRSRPVCYLPEVPLAKIDAALNRLALTYGRDEIARGRPASLEISFVMIPPGDPREPKFNGYSPPLRLAAAPLFPGGAPPVWPGQHEEAAAVADGQEFDDQADLVTLDQAASMVKKDKSTLVKYKHKGLPAPAVKGRSGQAALYSWRVLRPWLEERFGMKLPKDFPTLRRNA